MQCVMHKTVWSAWQAGSDWLHHHVWPALHGLEDLLHAAMVTEDGVLWLGCPAAAFTSVSGSVKHAFQTNGLRGPFQGLGATIVRNTPANSIYLGSFEVLKQQFAKMKGCE